MSKQKRRSPKRAPYIRHLVHRREKLGIRQVDVAKKIGVSQAALSRWERGNQEPDWAMVRKWAAALDMEIRVEMEAGRAPTVETPPCDSNAAS